MIGVESVDIDGIRIAYRSAGKGKPLVFLHGFTYSSYSFRYNLPVLSKMARVVCPDLVGHGKSDKPGRFDYALENQAGIIFRFCKKLGLEHIDLGGCSMGGALAMQVAISYPGLVDRLILVDSAGLELEMKSPHRFFSMPIVGHIAALVTVIRFARSTRQRMMSYSDDLEESRADRADYLKELKSFSTLAAGVRNLRANGAFQVADIDEIKQDTLVLWGELDQLFSKEYALKLAKMVKNSRLILLPGAGHLPNEEMPADFNQVVIDFLLKRLPKAGS